VQVNLERRYGIRLLLVALEHVEPEGFDLLDVASLTINWDAGQWKPFRELAFQTDFLRVGTVVFLTIVFAQPNGVWQANTQ
jgi:hypothetical protein